MKDRATIICRRDDRILLVARNRVRWSLPGGTVKSSETPAEAAHRELHEETSMQASSFTYLFHFGGLSKRHYVFLADLDGSQAPEAQNEIRECRWFRLKRIGTLPTSVPTKAIVALCVEYELLALA
jgi:8-oxo-dGTP diphosphatase